jgi:DNA processing protein
VDDEKTYWVGFNLVKGIGPTRLRLLLDAFGDVATAWKASSVDLEEAGLGQKLIKSMIEMRQGGELDRVVTIIEKYHIEVLTWNDPGYPRRLKEIEQSPPVLYVLGKFSEDDQWAVAVVGTRKVSAYGRQVTQEIVGYLAQNGVTIISGLARGIDGIAHQAALDAGGRTIAVLGNGLDYIYPPEHRRLAIEILDNGALVSDYPPGTAPESTNFPPRNRIISGLAQAVLVIEAGIKSGALITAAFAAEQGRHVFAVPGTIYAPQSKGTNLLIREGAHILLNGLDVLELLNLANVHEQRTARTVLPTNATEARLFEILSRESMHIDEIRNLAELPIETISGTLTLMELKGMVRQVGPMRYMAINEESELYEVGENNG